MEEKIYITLKCVTTAEKSLKRFLFGLLCKSVIINVVNKYGFSVILLRDNSEDTQLESE